MAIKRNDEVMTKVEQLSNPGESKSDTLLRVLGDALGEEESGTSEEAQRYQEALSKSTGNLESAQLKRGIDIEQSGDDHLEG